MSSYLRYLALKKEAHIWENSASAPHTSEEKRVSQQDTTLGAKSFRLAEALGISRAHLKSLAAIEAAAAGDAKQALFLGREIQEKPLDECVSSSLVQIAQQLSEQNLFGQTSKKYAKNLDTVSAFLKLNKGTLILFFKSLSFSGIPRISPSFQDSS